MSQLASPPPSFSMAEMETLALDLFGIKGVAKPLVSDRDQNALIQTKAGDFVIKVYNKDQKSDLVVLENLVLAHVEGIDPKFPVPKSLPSIKGALLVDHNGHIIRLLSYLEGSLLSSAPKSPTLSKSFGQFMGRFSAAMKSFDPDKQSVPTYREGHIWNLDNALLCKDYVADIVEDSNREMVARIFDRYETIVVPKLENLPWAMVHQDANDNNVLVDEGNQVSGLLDFGDTTHGRQINELAIMLSYALADQERILDTALSIISGYTAEFPLRADELEVVFDLAKIRLCVSVCVSSHRVKLFPENDYILQSQKPSFDLLKKFDAISPEFLNCVARKAGGFDAVYSKQHVENWIGEQQSHNLFPFDMTQTDHFTLSIIKGAAGADLVHDPKKHWDWIRSEFSKREAKYAIGLYGENRDVYDSDQFAAGPVGERRSVHLGLDFFLDSDTPVFAPLDGRVVSVVENKDPLDYGPTVVLAHKAGEANDEDAAEFYTLYGHLSRKTLSLLRVGQQVKAGDTIAFLGEEDVNGGWAPHLHFQIMTTLLSEEKDFSGNFNGASEPHLWPVWQDICLDPNLMIGLPPESFIVSK